MENSGVEEAILENCTRVHAVPPGADLGSSLEHKLSVIMPYKHRGSASAADDAEVLTSVLNSWRAYKAGQQKECVEHFGASAQHDSPLAVQPASDPDYQAFLAKAVLRGADALGADPQLAAAAEAYLCMVSPKVLGLSEEAAGARLEALAEQHKGSWWLHYARATHWLLRGDKRKSAEALTRAILAGGPCGLYYNRGRVYSGLDKHAQAARDYHKFLELAPPDHRTIPDVHYCMALDSIMGQRDFQAAGRHFSAGQAAEGLASPWVGYEPSKAKATVQLLLSLGPGMMQHLP